jgi:predicted metallo-beta-lactamase superfamily hydrolase
MNIEILGTESLGVRSLCCFVESADARVLIDPGVSLAPWRFGLRPHKRELAASKVAREKILARAAQADLLVISHYHFDHCTPAVRRRLEWSDEERANQLYRGKMIYAKSADSFINPSQRRRAYHLWKRTDCRVLPADGAHFKNVSFSGPLPHGEENSPRGWVIATVVVEGAERFVHASDIQCLHDPTVEAVLALRPTTLLVSGPPLYLSELDPKLAEGAMKNLHALIREVPVMILDHHFLRSEDALARLAELQEAAMKVQHKLVCAAEFAGRDKPLLLEARRRDLHAKEPGDPLWYQRLFDGDKRMIAEVEALAAEMGL